MSAAGLYGFDIVVCVVERTVFLTVVVTAYYKGTFGVLVFKVYPYFFAYFGDEVKAFDLLRGVVLLVSKEFWFDAFLAI